MADKNKLTVRILILIVVLLALVVLYAFAIRPAVSGFAVKAYNQGVVQGQSDLLRNVVTQIQQTANSQGVGNAQFPVGQDQVLVIQGIAQIVKTTTPAQTQQTQ